MSFADLQSQVETDRAQRLNGVDHADEIRVFSAHVPWQ